ncbi:hypothetical protein Dbac_1653 [Desulfomicrobium baculatum DSM 4028]|uniref:Uncharacterized protein n=2 Tax=Desulfomicrobium baculatum TaxID=899 RepID=C7LVI9_DESBD|nr:hypothetical protein Dbac_1653 [Desulfomicrobium baculatum DSM 4028]
MRDRKDQDGMEKNGNQGESAFSVWRLDDNNNEFLVRSGLTEEEALALVREYERKGHRQAYWVEKESWAADSVKSTAS